MRKPRPISGFPEWLPHEKLAEQHLIDVIRYVYELYGFSPLETAAIERTETLTAKGVVDKEIYALGRLREEPGERDQWEYGLHFDLTVPLARYVAMNYGHLNFPFKRYQIQKVWRGERPQEGRFREFYQADIDVIAENELPLHFDAEMPAVIHDIFCRLDIRHDIRLNHRQLLIDFYRGLEMSDEMIPAALREVDKLDKVGADGVKDSLGGLGLSDEVVASCLQLAAIRGPGVEVFEKARALGVSSPALDEVKTVGEALAQVPHTFDLGIVRGLDYYTGTIYETLLPDYPELGSICSGGRYENLASEFTNKKLPGVGISIGLSRLVSYLFAKEIWKPTRHCPTQVLVICPDEDDRPKCALIAEQLRRHGIATEVYSKAQAMKKQLRYADRKGIPQVLFPHKYSETDPTVEVKTLASGEQVTVPLPEWAEKNRGPAAPADRSGR